MTRTLFYLLMITAGSIMLPAVSSAQTTPQYSTTGMPQGPSCPQLGVVSKYASGSKVQMLYKPSYFGTAPSGMMSAIYLKTTQAASATTHTWKNVLIRMQLYVPDTLTSIRPQPFIKTGWTTVFSQATWTVTGSFVADQWIKIPLQTPFGFTRERNLLVEFSIDSTITGGIGLRGIAVSLGNFYGRNVDTFTNVPNYGSNLALGFDFVSAGVNGTSINEGITTYPVPAYNEMYVAGAPINARYAVSDIAGKMLFSTSYDANKPIDVSQLSAGLYFLNIYQDGNRISSLRFTKQ